MPYFRSSYTFSIAGSVRTFHHRWYMGGRVYECDACSSSCDIRACYSQHWQPALTACALDISDDISRPLCSTEQRAQLAIVAARRINTFILCNERTSIRNPSEFLLDAGINAVPQLLRLLFHGVSRLHVRLGFHTRAYNGADLLFNSSELALEHHLDIGESVDMLFLMLLERIEAYMYVRYPTRAAEYCVKRIKIHVRRETLTKSGESASTLATDATLPLQYRIKHATAMPRDALSVEATATANIYCFRVCARTQELYAVPYQLGKCRINGGGGEKDESNILRWPWDTEGCGSHYIMLQSVEGKLQQLLEITNLYRFLRTEADDRVHMCTRCRANFTQRTRLQLHKSLDCGRGFEVLHLDSNYLEIYESCLQMRCANYKWPLYGIIQ
ncbi:PREDICTED: protein terminus-like [Rhagoletis zephyria]|uniref:protein terminus-like n=1 Tax=Rhagoletis zephyria TaxID=28612 RepID=UPI0008114B2C|nr:PREDICTED: protein terminus-like [Rhagoletis zephyria]